MTLKHLKRSHLKQLYTLMLQGKHAKFKKYPAHSAHVTNVRWMVGDSHVVSSGGGDTALMMWAHGGAGSGTGGCGNSDDSDTDSEEEGGEIRKTQLYHLCLQGTFMFMFKTPKIKCLVDLMLWS